MSLLASVHSADTVCRQVRNMAVINRAPQSETQSDFRAHWAAAVAFVNGAPDSAARARARASLVEAALRERGIDVSPSAGDPVAEIDQNNSASQ